MRGPSAPAQYASVEVERAAQQAPTATTGEQTRVAATAVGTRSSGGSARSGAGSASHANTAGSHASPGASPDASPDASPSETTATCATAHARAGAREAAAGSRPHRVSAVTLCWSPRAALATHTARRFARRTAAATAQR